LARISIAGAGAIGGFLAALLQRAGHQPILITNPKTAELIKAHGLHIESPLWGHFIARPQCETHLTQNVEFVILSPKAPGLPESCRRLSPLPQPAPVIVPVLNGVGHLELLREKFPDSPVAAGTIGKIDASKTSEGHIIHRSGEVELTFGSSNPEIRSRLETLAQVFRASGIKTNVLSTENAVIWNKLARLNALACVTAASGLSLGKIMASDQWCDALRACVAEGAAVASAEGIHMNADAIWNEILAFPPSLTTSLMRDLEADLPSELEWIPCGVLRRARSLNVACPTMEMMVEYIKSRYSVKIL
jgi:2-dehydropantoate 2-reductase